MWSETKYYNYIAVHVIRIHDTFQHCKKELCTDTMFNKNVKLKNVIEKSNLIVFVFVLFLVFKFYLYSMSFFKLNEKTI